MNSVNTIIKRKTRLKNIFVYFILFLLAKSTIFYFLLPDTVASHFNFEGEADSWSSKESFIFIEVILTLFFAVFFYFIDWLIIKVPDSMVNLPNKEYWLAEERRNQTYAKISSFTYLFGILTAGFVFIISLNSYYYNFTKETLPSLFWLSLIIYIALTINFLIHLFKEFKIPDKIK